MSPSGDALRPVDPQLVEYLVVVVPDEWAVEVVLDSIEALARTGAAVVLDGAVVAHHHAGGVSISEVPGSPGRSAFVGTGLGVLSEHDLELVAEAVPAGSLAVVVVVEDQWAKPLADAARSVGGHVAGGERIPPARLLSVLPQLRAPRGGAP